jgi:hypothetical protein
MSIVRRGTPRAMTARSQMSIAGLPTVFSAPKRAARGDGKSGDGDPVMTSVVF